MASLSGWEPRPPAPARRRPAAGPPAIERRRNRRAAVGGAWIRPDAARIAERLHPGDVERRLAEVIDPLAAS